MLDRVRFAVVGTSSIADSFVDAVGAVGRAAYVGSMSRSAERAAATTERLGGRVPFTSLDEVLGCGEVDAVYIATPNALHIDQALACIAAGKHVLVEKPVATEAATAARLYRAAREAGVVALEAMRPVHDPNLDVIREAMARIGRIRRASLRFGKYSSRYDEVLAGRQTNIFDARLGTGALMDIGVYCASTMIALFGPPRSVTAEAVLLRSEETGGAIDGAGTIVARYDDMVAELSYSKITQDLLPCQIEGEKGTVTFRGVSVPSSGELYLRARSEGNAGYATLGVGEDALAPLAFTPCENNMRYEVEDFVACVLDGLDAGPYQRLSLETLGVLDEVRRQTGVVFPADEAGAKRD